MVQELVVNASLLLSALYVGTLLFRKPLLESSPWHSHAWYGLQFGAAAVFLFAFHGNEEHGRLLCFHLTPIALGALHGTARSTLWAAAIAALYMAASGGGLAEAAETLAVAVLSAAAAHWLRRRRAAAWAAVTALSTAAPFATAWLADGGYEAGWGTALLFIGCHIGAMWGADSFLRWDRTRSALMTEYTYLTQHDLLTGLLNFQTFQARLQSLLMEGRRVCFVLIDCDDVKSLNTEQGFHTVDGTLQRVANLLRTFFSDALLLGRFGSDEFAVVIPAPADVAARLVDSLETHIPDLADIRLAYGYAVYPDEEQDPGTFITLVQKRMLEAKRLLWLEREAHWLHNERLSAIGELAAGMAHEIRNPLTTVKGFLQVSKQNGYNVAEYYDIIMHEIKRMSDLTAEFLQFSKPTALKPMKLSIQDCVMAAIQLTESEITKYGHQLYIEAEEQPLYAFVEKDKIVQVLVNLIRNAIDAMAESSGTLSISVYPRGEYGLVDVTDTGIGISDENLVRLFQPFFSTKSKGTGLGLSISQKIINEHGGYISVRSKVGFGTTFTIRMPLSDRLPV